MRESAITAWERPVETEGWVEGRPRKHLPTKDLCTRIARFGLDEKNGLMYEASSVFECRLVRSNGRADGFDDRRSRSPFVTLEFG